MAWKVTQSSNCVHEILFPSSLPLGTCVQLLSAKSVQVSSEYYSQAWDPDPHEVTGDDPPHTLGASQHGPHPLLPGPHPVPNLPGGLGPVP